MNAFQQAKAVFVTPPGAYVDNTAFTTTTIDTLGYHKLAIYFGIGDSDIAMTTLKVTESDDSGMSGASDITGLVYGTSTNPDTGSTSALPTATDDNKIFAFFVNLQGRKRYIDVNATAGNGTNGTYGTCIAFLYNGDNIPENATERGLAANLIA